MTLNPRRLALAILLTLAAASPSLAAERLALGAQSKTPGEQVEMFAAMKAGDLDVKVIPKDDTELRVMIKNNSKKPLSVKLPDAFATVPVLAQFGGGGGGVGGGGGGGGQNQAGGGGMGMMGGGGGGMMGGGGGGFFNVPAEKEVQFKVATVCLEHGKKEPRPAIPYTIKPIESYTSKAETQETLKMLGYGQIPQRAAQAAAWHFENGMSWEELAAKRIKHLNGTSEPYFSPQEIDAGMRVAAAATQRAKERPVQTPVTSTASLEDKK